MKKEIVKVCGLILCLVLCSCVLAQTKSSPTVKDYFLSLPKTFFENDELPNHEWMLAQRGSIVDVKNGYLFAQGDGAQVSIWVCLFKKKDGKHLIAVQTTAGDTSEFTYLHFYLYEQGKWKDVTAQTLPVKHHDQYRYDLPRYGRTIKVTKPNGQKLYDWEWNEERFILKRNEASETRCGWFSNPTPANAWLRDRDGEWIIGIQGGHQAEGDWPPTFKRGQWIRTNINYGYGCACLKVHVNRKTNEVLKIESTHARPLAVCRRDRFLKKWEGK